MTIKTYLISIVVALGLGFGIGIFIKGHHEAAKTAVAVQQIKQLGGQVAQEMATRKQQEQIAQNAQAQADASDTKAQKLAAKYAARPKPTPLAPTPNQDPVFNTVTIPNDQTDLIAALQKDVADQKTLVLGLRSQLATDKTIIDNQAKEIVLGKIALDAQIAANRASEIKGGIIGGGAVGVVAVLVHVITHI
jgi:hypothetical protein